MIETCELCGGELLYEDYFGKLDFDIPDPHIQKEGEIYRCENCQEYYHTYDGDLELYRGYPC